MSGPDALPFQVTTPAQAAALLDFTYGARLLEKFAVPSTSSQAAHALAQPANRVAYHVRKLSQAGLLRPADRQGKRVLYQAAAQVFHVPRALVRLDEPLTLIEPLMREVTHAYAHAVLGWQTRRDARSPEGDETQLVVRLGGQKPQPPAPDTGQTAKPEGLEPEGAVCTRPAPADGPPDSAALRTGPGGPGPPPDRSGGAGGRPGREDDDLRGDGLRRPPAPVLTPAPAPRFTVQAGHAARRGGPMYHDELRYHVARERHTDLLAEATGTRQGRPTRASFARPVWRWALTWHSLRFTVRLPLLTTARKPGLGR